jgi:acyl CoA:acetate/3-ketoacid CoA transferase beta subunit
VACVSRVYTDHGAFAVTASGFQLIDSTGLTATELSARCGIETR